MSLISVKRLSKTFEYYKKQPGLFGAVKSLFKREKLETKAVQDISFEINEGELVGFLGPNGAGKTTTLKMLSGILYPTHGAARVLNFTPWERKKEFQKQFSLVMGQKNQLWWDLPAMESFLLNKEIYGVDENEFQQTIDELGSLLHVNDILDITVRKLSLGQRMKCELIAALLHSPKVLFLDEPTIGLDVASAQKMREFIKYYNQQKKTTILLTSHYMDDVEQLCERVIIIDNGNIIQDTSLRDLRKQFAKHKIISITFNHDVLKGDIDKFGKIIAFDSRKIKIRVLKEKVREVAANMLTSLPVDDVLIGEPDIEEIIQHMFNHVKNEDN